MRQLAQRYAGKIDTWIIWNEVDIPDGDWRTWDGSIDDYVQLMAVGYQAAKAGNPRAQVAHYGSPWWYDHGEYLAHFLDIIAARPDAREHNYFFDIGNLHLYSRAADIARIIPWYRDQLAAHGIPTKPLWIGETNVIPYDDPIWPEGKGGFRASMDEQAAYIIESFATYVALNVDRIGVNRLLDGADFQGGGEPFGLLRNDGTTRPAFKAYQVATRYFGGTTPVSYRDDNGIVTVVLQRPDQRITVAWTLKPAARMLDLAAIAPGAVLVGKYGNVDQVWASDDGTYRVELGPATANSNDGDALDFVVGGDPVILIERFDGEFASTFNL